MLILAMLLTAPVVTPAGTTRAQNEALALALHRRMDANHDGYLTYAEIRATALALFMSKGQPTATVKLPEDPVGRAAFERADTDHDGRISVGEAIAGADRAFDEADTNHDGVVSAEEHGAYAVRSLAALQKEMAKWKPLPCQPGALCATARSGQAAADRLDRLDRFRYSLSLADRKRLDTALPRSPDGGIAQCDHTEGSRASCEAAAYLPALRATDLLSRFMKTVPTG